ncbi:MAG: hypothetical protein IH820_00100 [Bacteroidetes bacterium]|nr:hypothetical protein [Bacteroidota bacterium]
MEQRRRQRFRHFTAYAVLLSLTLIVFSACGSSSTTRITGSWAKAENQAKQFNRIMILGLSDNVPARAQAEQAIAGRLTQEGFRTLEGITLISPQALKDYKGDREKAKAFLEEHGIDAVIVISVRDVKEEERYIPGTAMYTPMSYGYYGGFYSYWYSSYDRVYTPGYYESSTEIFLESNLYDIATEDLLWSAQSKTVNSESIPELVRAYADLLVKDLLAKNVITP